MIFWYITSSQPIPGWLFCWLSGICLEIMRVSFQGKWVAVVSRDCFPRGSGFRPSVQGGVGVFQFAGGRPRIYRHQINDSNQLIFVTILYSSSGTRSAMSRIPSYWIAWMVAKGVPLKLVQEIAGHSSITTTMGYAKTFAGGAYDTLSQAFGYK